MSSSSEQFNTLSKQIAGLQGKLTGLSPNPMIYAASGERVFYGCKVTEGTSSSDMIVALESQASGDSAHLNPDLSESPLYPFEYPNIASLKSGGFYTADLTATVDAAPATGLGRYDIAYIYLGPTGPGFAIATGTPGAGVKTAYDADGLDTSEYDSGSDVAIPVGAFPVARIYVEDAYTGIANARIADLRRFITMSSIVSINNNGVAFVNGSGLLTTAVGFEFNSGTETLTVSKIDGASIGSVTPAAGAFTTLSAANDVTFSGGTANGVVYLNGSKVATSGTSFIFDGTNAGIGVTPPAGFRLTLKSVNGTTAAGINLLGPTASTGLSINAVTSATDTDFEIWNAQNGYLRFGLNAAEQMRLTTTGLGILNSSPGSLWSGAYQLVVGSGSGAAGMTIYTGNTSAGTLAFADGTVSDEAYSGYVQYSHGTNTFELGTAGISRAFLNATGYGVGGTPSQKFDVQAAGGLVGLFRNTSDTSDARVRVQNTQSYLEIGQDGTGGYIQQNGAYPILFYINGGQRLSLDSSGNLNSSGSVLASGAVPSSGAGVTLTYNGTTGSIYSYDWGTSAYKALNIAGNSVDISAASNTRITFGVNGAEQMRLTTAGLVIGGTTQDYKLEVVANQDSNHWGRIRNNNAGSSAFAGIAVNAYGNSWGWRVGSIANNSNALELILDVSSPVVKATFDTTGNFFLKTNTRLEFFSNNYLYADSSAVELSSSSVVKVVTNGALRATFDASGNLGLGVTPSAWDVSQNAIDIGYSGAIKSSAGSGSVVSVINNAYYGSSGWTYKVTGMAAGLYDIRDTGEHVFYSAAVGTAGSPITFTQAMKLDASGNWIQKLNGSAPTLSDNSTMTFELTSDTSLSVVVKGSDGTVRSGSIALAA